ncbi:MAG: hypothetical protein DSY83_15355 [Flavobacteriia bacterium]|nr:MAG: hypothetical protein DSY83_15355 [Flavobacteriia bacterium]
MILYFDFNLHDKIIGEGSHGDNHNGFRNDQNLNYWAKGAFMVFFHEKSIKIPSGPSCSLSNFRKQGTIIH